MKRIGDPLNNENSKKAKLTPLEANWLDLLPDELITNVLSYLNEDTLRHLRLVYQRLFHFINVSHFSLGLILDSEMNELIRVFGRYHKPIRLTFRKLHKIDGHKLKMVETLTNLTSLNIGHRSLGIEKLTNLQDLSAFIASNDMTSLRHLTQLTRLQTENLDHIPSSVQILIATNLQRLTTDATQLRELRCAKLPDMETLEHVPYITTLVVHKVENETKSQHIFQQLTQLRVLHFPQCTELLNTEMPALTKLELPTLWTNLNLETNFRGLVNLKTLKIADAHLSSKASAALTLLHQLEDVGLHFKRDRYAYQLKAPTSLCTLRLQFMHGDCDLSHFTRFTQLMHFSMQAQGEIKNSQSVTHLSNLQFLMLATANPRDDLYLTLTPMRHLTHLTMHCSGDLEGLTNLAKLMLISKKVVYVGGLPSLTNLTELNASCLENDWRELKNLTKLRQLKLRNGDLLHLTGLVQLTSLTAKNVTNCSALLALTRLQELDATFDRVAGPELEEVKKKLKFANHLATHIRQSSLQ
jgi:hypothetical protein